jgi:hypothetical protein
MAWADPPPPPAPSRGPAGAPESASPHRTLPPVRGLGLPWSSGKGQASVCGWGFKAAKSWWGRPRNPGILHTILQRFPESPAKSRVGDPSSEGSRVLGAALTGLAGLARLAQLRSKRGAAASSGRRIFPTACAVVLGGFLLFPTFLAHPLSPAVFLVFHTFPGHPLSLLRSWASFPYAITTSPPSRSIAGWRARSLFQASTSLRSRIRSDGVVPETSAWQTLPSHSRSCLRSPGLSTMARAFISLSVEKYPPKWPRMKPSSLSFPCRPRRFPQRSLRCQLTMLLNRGSSISKSFAAALKEPLTSLRALSIASRSSALTRAKGRRRGPRKGHSTQGTASESSSLNMPADYAPTPHAARHFNL